MTNGKYSKVLTVILIVAIIVIVVLIGVVAFDWYKAYNTGADVENFIGQFDDYVNSIKNEEVNLELNETVENGETIDPIIDENTMYQNTETNQESGSSGSSTIKYKGFNVIGKIRIPKTDIEYPILEEASGQAIEVAIGKLYGPGINEVGNVVLIGHNYRNGTFFSNNNKLSNR